MDQHREEHSLPRRGQADANLPPAFGGGGGRHDALRDLAGARRLDEPGEAGLRVPDGPEPHQLAEAGEGGGRPGAEGVGVLARPARDPGRHGDRRHEGGDARVPRGLRRRKGTRDQSPQKRDSEITNDLQLQEPPGSDFGRNWLGEVEENRDARAK